MNVVPKVLALSLAITLLAMGCNSSPTGNTSPPISPKTGQSTPPLQFGWHIFAPTGTADTVLIPAPDGNGFIPIADFVAYSFQYPSDWKLQTDVRSVTDANGAKVAEWPDLIRLSTGQHCEGTVDPSTGSWFGYDYWVISRSPITVGRYTGIRDVEALDHNYAIAYCIESPSYAFEMTFYSAEQPTGHSSEEGLVERIISTVSFP